MMPDDFLKKLPKPIKTLENLTNIREINCKFVKKK